MANAKSACNSTALHLPDQSERAQAPYDFRFYPFLPLVFGMVAAHNHLQHLPWLTVKTSLIPKAEGLCCTVLPVQKGYMGKFGVCC